MKLSTRLKTIIEMVPKSHTLADIGTDHGFVPIALVQSGQADRAIAGDVNPEPLLRAQDHIDRFGLSDRIETRLGSGLQVLKKGEADTVLIAGMGGLLICKILEEDPEKTASIQRLVLSPHRDVDCVREAVTTLGFEIYDEAVVQEEGKFYFILAAEKTDHPQTLTDIEKLYGPVLLKKRPEAWLRYLTKEREKKQEILEKLLKKDQKEAEYSVIEGLRQELKLLDEVLRIDRSFKRGKYSWKI